MVKSSKLPRKAPKQSRSSDLVDAIYQASVRIFSSGKDVFNTRKVAELAGVSVGSLYQYFPNKEALIGVLIERETKKHLAVLREEYARLQKTGAAGDFSVVLARVSKEVLLCIYKDRHFLKGVLPHVFNVDRLQAVIDSRQEANKFLANVFLDRRIAEDEKSALMRAMVITSSFGGFVELLVFGTDEDFDFEHFCIEVGSMLARYCEMEM